MKNRSTPDTGCTHPYLEKGREILRLREYDPFIQDIAALLTGAREILYYVSPGFFDLPYVTKLCGVLGLSHHAFPIPRPDLADSSTVLLIGKSKRRLKEAALEFRRPLDDFEFGKLLGYPACCNAFYSGRTIAGIPPGREQPVEIIRRVYGNTAEKTALPFLLNNVYNFFSRHDRLAPRLDMAKQQLLFSLNRRMIPSALYVVAWHPCSYRCADSLGKAGAVYSFLTEHVPSFALKLKEHLARPVIFVNKCEFVALEGRGRGEKEARYAAVSPPFSLAIALTKSVSKGSRVVVHEDFLSIHGKSGPGLKIRLPGPLLLDFH